MKELTVNGTHGDFNTTSAIPRTGKILMTVVVPQKNGGIEEVTVEYDMDKLRTEIGDIRLLMEPSHYVMHEATTLGLQGQLGTWDPTLVPDSTIFPYHSVGHLTAGCTATLVGPRIIISAAHCFYNTLTDQYYQEQSFCPGTNNGHFTYGCFALERWEITSEYVAHSSYSPDHDFAVAVLQQSPGLSFWGVKATLQDTPDA